MENDYVTSTDRVRDLRRQKEELYQRSMPKQDVERLVDHYLRRPAYAHLKGRHPVFLVTPSTTGANKLPYYFAKRLQSECGGDIVTGWAAPLERQKASLKGGLGKMRNPARFAAIGDKIANLPQDRPLVLVDDVVTTGETTDALRELLTQNGREIHSVASLGQSELRKVSERDIERIADKLGEPSLRTEIEGVLQGRLKHKANYIERALHEDTRNEIRAYFLHEHRRLQGLGTVHEGTVHEGTAQRLRGPDASDPRLQFSGSAQTGNPDGRESEIGASPRHAPRQRSALDAEASSLVSSLQALRADVAQGKPLALARDEGLRLLKGDQIHQAPRMLLSYELSQALKGEKHAKPFSEIVAFAGEMRRTNVKAYQQKSLHRV